MLHLAQLSAADVSAMSYNELIGLVRETNRPPGGRLTVREIAVRCLLDRQSRVLDVGTSTGFTAIELARSVRCDVTGIDINEDSLEEARRRAAALQLANVTFVRGDANDLPFDDATFDLVFAGNLISLIPEPRQLLLSLSRAIHSDGYLAVVPMYYRRTPPTDLVRAVSNAIKVDIVPKFRAEAIAPCKLPGFESVYTADFEFDIIDDADVQRFCRTILARPHLDVMAASARARLEAVYADYMTLFARNLAHMGFSVLLLRRTVSQEDPELFTARPVVTDPYGGSRSVS